MDAIAPSAPAKQHHQIAGLHIARVAATRRNAHRAAEDQRVSPVARVEQHRAVHRRDAQLVAVVAHAGHHPSAGAGRVKLAGAKLIGGHVGHPEAEHIGVGDRAGRHAKQIADHPADAGVGPAKRLKRARVVVGLNLDAQLIFVGEGDDPCVIDEGREYPGVARQWTVDGGRCYLLRSRPTLLKHIFGRDHQKGLDQAVDLDLAFGLLKPMQHRVEVRIASTVHRLPSTVRRSIAYLRLKSLMATVLAPGLRDRLKLAVRGVAAQASEVVAHRTHLIKVEGQNTGLANPQQLSVVGPTQGHALDLRQRRAGRVQQLGIPCLALNASGRME